jgi:hypothetical protein
MRAQMLHKTTTNFLSNQYNICCDIYFNIGLKFTISQEHTNALSALMNNSQAVNLMSGFINDLSDAAIEVLKEAKVLFTVLLFSCIRVVQCLNKFASA